MYNSRQKNAFLKTVKANKRRYKIMFDEFAAYEEEHNMDICDVDSTIYPELLMKYLKPQRFGYFYGLYRSLMAYRMFCYSRNLVDPVEFFSHELEPKVDMEDMYSVFSEHNEGVKLRTPGECIRCFQSRLLNDVSNDCLIPTLTADDYKLAYVVLKYLGVDDYSMSLITRDCVTTINNVLYINVNATTYEVYDDAAQELLRRLCEVREIRTPLPNTGVKITGLDDRYLLAQEKDDTSELRQKRIEKIYNTISKKISVYDVNNVPSITDVMYQGTIYRMCVGEHRFNLADYENFTSREWVALYESYFTSNQKKYDPSSISTSNTTVVRAMEIEKGFFEEYRYLDENNEWPQ